MKKYYDYLEQHQDSAWWYHGYFEDNNHNSKEKAESSFKKYFWFDLTRPHVIIEHNSMFPDIALFTKDFKTFIDKGEYIVIEDDNIKIL